MLVTVNELNRFLGGSSVFDSVVLISDLSFDNFVLLLQILCQSIKIIQFYTLLVKRCCNKLLCIHSDYKYLRIY